MGKTAEGYLDIWRSWLGYSEANGKYKEIIDIYNQEAPLPRDYEVSYQDAWCDVTVSAAAIKAGAAELIGKECSCEEHIKIFKEKGIWIEDGTIMPTPGYLIVYNWNDGTQPNDGFSDHIGVVECVDGNTIICIEGNYKKAVTRREIPVGWGYIRGYAAPKYDSGKAEGVLEDAAYGFENDNGIDVKDHEVDSDKGIISHNRKLGKSMIWKGVAAVNSWLNVRKWAGTSYETCSFSPLMNETEVDVCDSIEDENGDRWYYIKYKGKYGFVHSDYVKRK